MSSLRAFTHQGRKKLDPRARPCILVGYFSQTKGYQLWDPKKEEIIQTKHVRFDETKLGYEQAERQQTKSYSDFLIMKLQRKNRNQMMRKQVLGNQRTKKMTEDVM